MGRQTLTFTGAITERQSYLDGGRLYMIEAEGSAERGWRMTLSLRWPLASELVEEGDLTLVEPGGAELSGVLAGGRAVEIIDEDEGVSTVRLDLRFVVSGGEGGFSAAGGSVRVSGTVTAEREGAGGSLTEGALLTVELDIEGAGDVRG